MAWNSIENRDGVGLHVHPNLGRRGQNGMQNPFVEMVIIFLIGTASGAEVIADLLCLFVFVEQGRFLTLLRLKRVT